jgi:hypothetical protein
LFAHFAGRQHNGQLESRIAGIHGYDLEFVWSRLPRAGCIVQMQGVRFPHKDQFMATSIIQNPPTIEQRRQLDEDLGSIEERLQGIIVFVRGCYGKDSQAAIRADEIAGALQRLKWELERVQQKTRAAVV